MVNIFRNPGTQTVGSQLLNRPTPAELLSIGGSRPASGEIVVPKGRLQAPESGDVSITPIAIRPGLACEDYSDIRRATRWYVDSARSALLTAREKHVLSYRKPSTLLIGPERNPEFAITLLDYRDVDEPMRRMCATKLETGCWQQCWEMSGQKTVYWAGVRDLSWENRHGNLFVNGESDTFDATMGVEIYSGDLVRTRSYSLVLSVDERLHGFPESPTDAQLNQWVGQAVLSFAQSAQRMFGFDSLFIDQQRFCIGDLEISDFPMVGFDAANRAQPRGRDAGTLFEPELSIRLSVLGNDIVALRPEDRQPKRRVLQLSMWQPEGKNDFVPLDPALLSYWNIVAQAATASVKARPAISLLG